jgi:hypothetical protein
MLLAALKAEVGEYVAAHADHRDEAGHALVVRNRSRQGPPLAVSRAGLPRAFARSSAVLGNSLGLGFDAASDA